MSFMEIFQPGLKFLREERERQRLHVAYPTDGADPLMEIDLDSGTATIVIPSPAPVLATEAPAGAEMAQSPAADSPTASAETPSDGT